MTTDERIAEIKKRAHSGHFNDDDWAAAIAVQQEEEEILTRKLGIAVQALRLVDTEHINQKNWVDLPVPLYPGSRARYITIPERRAVVEAVDLLRDIKGARAPADGPGCATHTGDPHPTCIPCMDANLQALKRESNVKRIESACVACGSTDQPCKCLGCICPHVECKVHGS